MKNSDQAEQGYMRLAEDTLEGMSEEELQEAPRTRGVGHSLQY